MTDNITVTGVVGSDPKHHVTSQGLAITSFRLASTRRYFDRSKGTWEDGETNWYTVSAFRQLAFNASTSIVRGERVVVHGRLRLRAWETGEKSGTAVEIEADAIGHDLTWGVSTFTKVRLARTTGGSGDEPVAAEAGEAAGWPDVAEATSAAGAAVGDEPEAAADDASDGLDGFEPGGDRERVGAVA
ncbi:single-stranded DNA-binding protein [Agromyces sp. ISL-38]|uniref:single-stranded DNA-binding protein n=1 Tax=Agromyces sp. ISL-38 TaxID=2819107 RepID=UPI001BEADFA3|nr:single-stranded DNA-binding protein [Agromyces sp. ISL-38]MBT2499784.1 single-stranded DNA-binding protein [Agromyces sp. ISL-38]MBT2516067.1 single-stranded DNA-binding protein [Streptomyces sp. ISL-90]